MEDHMKKVFEHMKGSQIPQADLSEDEFKTCLYGKSADRLEIIQWMVSELHDKYKLNLQKRIGNGLKLGKLKKNKCVVKLSNEEKIQTLI